MLASDLRPLTPENFNAVVDARGTLVIAGVIFRPTLNEQGRPVWRGANGVTVRLSRLDDLMDADVPMAYLPSTVNAE